MIVNVHFYGTPEEWAMPGHDVRVRPELGSACDVVVMHAPGLINRKQYVDGQFVYYPDAIKIGITHEPRHKCEQAYGRLEGLSHKFRAIFVYDRILFKSPNAVWQLQAECWLKDRHIPKKTVLLTALCSCRATQGSHNGYRARAMAAELLTDMGVTVYGRGGYADVPGKARNTSGIPGSVYPGDKWEVIAPAQFSVEAECNRVEYWFTEKLLDCLVMKTVPVYRGAPNVGDYFDTRGMLLWDTLADLRSILEDIQAGRIQYADFELYLSVNRVEAYRYAYPIRDCARKIAAILEIYAQS